MFRSNYHEAYLRHMVEKMTKDMLNPKGKRTLDERSTITIKKLPSKTSSCPPGSRSTSKFHP